MAFMDYINLEQLSQYISTTVPHIQEAIANAWDTVLKNYPSPTDRFDIELRKIYDTTHHVVLAETVNFLTKHPSIGFENKTVALKQQLCGFEITNWLGSGLEVFFAKALTSAIENQKNQDEASKAIAIVLNGDYNRQSLNRFEVEVDRKRAALEKLAQRITELIASGFNDKMLTKYRFEGTFFDSIIKHAVEAAWMKSVSYGSSQLLNNKNMFDETIKHFKVTCKTEIEELLERSDLNVPLEEWFVFWSSFQNNPSSF